VLVLFEDNEFDFVVSDVIMFGFFGIDLFEVICVC